nr:flavin-containing monooxygenase 5-like [Parasteatoda tepidariorum]
MVSKRAAVIGGGPCGLGAIQTLKQEGIEPVCFERTGHIGGLWRYHDDDVDGIASVMKTTIINTSKELGAMSTFPPLAEYPNYMHNTLMHEYIVKAAEQNGLLPHVRYHHETKSIEMAEDYEKTGRWKVTNKNTQTGELVSEIFDFVCVCIGHHVYPNIPTFPNQEEFEGKIMHTHSLKKVDGFEDQRVVVVGVGNSGMDAAVELSAVTKQVMSLNTKTGVSYLHQVVQKNILGVLVHQELSLVLVAVEHQRPSVICNVICVVMYCFLLCEETEADTVFLATGYKVMFPFLSDDIVRVVDNKVQLYKFMYPPHLPHPTLAILGLVQPNGPGFPVGEMQCRWASRVMSGKLKLPSKEQMIADIDERLKWIRGRFVDSPRHTLQVDFISYQDELAEEIGVKPNFWKIAFTDPKLFWALLFGPSLSYQYRLQGPHSWDGARNAILTYKDRIMTPLQRPGHQKTENKKQLMNMRLIIKLLFLLPFLYFFFLVMFR